MMRAAYLSRDHMWERYSLCLYVRPMKQETTRAGKVRIDSGVARDVIDSIKDRFGPVSISHVYKFIAMNTGVHPVTLLRYHRGDLKTVPKDTLSKLEELLKRLQNMEISPTYAKRRSRLQAGATQNSDRVPVKNIKALLDKLMDAMGLTERQVLYRSISEQTGIHETTLLRYYNNGLSTAPRSLEEKLKELLRQCSSQVPLKLRRSERGPEVIPRAVFKARVDKLLEAGEYESKSELFKDMASTLGIDVDRFRKYYYDKRIVLVPNDFLEEVEKRITGLEYDPSKSFYVGERLRHPLFGIGVVAEKQSHNRMVVQLPNGKRIMLREQYRHDPYWSRESGMDFGTDGDGD